MLSSLSAAAAEPLEHRHVSAGPPRLQARSCMYMYSYCAAAGRRLILCKAQKPTDTGWILPLTTLNSGRLWQSASSQTHLQGSGYLGDWHAEKKTNLLTTLIKAFFWGEPEGISTKMH